MKWSLVPGTLALVLLTSMMTGCSTSGSPCPLDESEVLNGLGVREVVITQDEEIVSGEVRFKVCKYAFLDTSYALAPSFTIFFAPLENMSSVEELTVGERVDIGVEAFFRTEVLNEGDDFLDGSQTSLNFIHDEHFLAVQWPNRVSGETPTGELTEVGRLVVASGDVAW